MSPDSERFDPNGARAGDHPPAPIAFDAKGSEGANGVRTTLRRVLLDEMEALYRYILPRVAWDTTSCEDVLQQTIVAALRSGRAPEDEGEQRAWVRGVASNLAKRHWRDRSRGRRAIERCAERRGPEIVERLESDCPHRVLQDDELRATLLEAIGSLSAEDQRLLYAFYRHGKSGAELADEYATSVKGIEMRLYRARARLRAELNNRAPEIDP